MNEQTVFRVAIDGDFPYVVISEVNSEFALARREMYINALLLSLLSSRDTFFRDRSDLEGRRYRTKEAKQKKRQKRKRNEV